MVYSIVYRLKKLSIDYTVFLGLVEWLMTARLTPSWSDSLLL